MKHTCRKARLLMGPRIFPFLYCLCPSLLPTGENSLVLDDPDIVWGITVFPVKHKEATIHANSTSANSGGSNSSSHDRSISNSSNSSEEHDSIVGKATPRHAHIDGGRASIFQDQLIRPNEMEPTEGDAAEPFSLNEALMQVRLFTKHQVGHPKKKKNSSFLKVLLPPSSSPSWSVSTPLANIF